MPAPSPVPSADPVGLAMKSFGLDTGGGGIGGDTSSTGPNGLFHSNFGVSAPSLPASFWQHGGQQAVSLNNQTVLILGALALGAWLLMKKGGR